MTDSPTTPGYENAPATRLLLTHCACCGRPLVDAVSVEAGVGPDCRERHGYGEAQEAADWDQAERELPPEVAIDRYNGTAREAANQLVHRIAAEQTGPNVLSLVRAVRALGFVFLADRVAKRLARISVEAAGDELVVKGPYSESAVDIMRRVPTRRWHAESKTNRFKATARGALFAALKSAYPGEVGIGPKGLFQL